MYDIKSRRLALNMTLEEVGEIVGVGKSTVRKWENGMIDNMKRDKIALLAKALKISPLVLLSEDSTVGENEHNIIHIYNQLTPPRQQKVYNFTEYQLSEQQKVVNIEDYITENLVGYVSAGTGEYQTEEINEEVQLPKSIIPEQKYDLVLQVNGNSMTPMFKDKEYIFVRTDSEYRSGQIGVFIIDGESYLKKAYIENDQIRLVSLNDEYPDQIFKDFNDVKLVGTVVM